MKAYGSASVFTIITLLTGFTFSSGSVLSKRCKSRRHTTRYRDRCWNEFCTSVNVFSLDLMKDFSELHDNFIISPFSIATAFAMLYVGANGKTKTEMANVFKWKRFQNGSLAPEAQELLTAITREPTRFTLPYMRQKVFSLANNVWIDRKLNVLDTYKRTLSKYFHVHPKEVSFKWNSEDIRKQINNWVEKKTEKKIKELFSPDTISSMTRMVLANAIYFKGEWSTPFNPRSTHTDHFYPYENMLRFTKVKYMHERGMSLLTYQDKCEKVKLVGLPYEDDFMMLIAMPMKSNIADTIKNITPSVFNKWLMKLKYKKVDLLLPKFQVENRIDLVSYFKEKKMEDLFTQEKANLSGITRDTLYVSAAVHKSFVSVDETGTTASGATGIGVDTYSSRKPIKINRPFLFYIICRKTNAVMFNGKVTFPKEVLK